jgi:hypothetical protein
MDTTDNKPKAGEPKSTKPPVNPEVKKEDDENKINSPESAKKFFNKNFKLPEGLKTAYVTEDGNVFWGHNADSGFAHARQKEIKIFTINP